MGVDAERRGCVCVCRWGCVFCALRVRCCVLCVVCYVLCVVCCVWCVVLHVCGVCRACVECVGLWCSWLVCSVCCLRSLRCLSALPLCAVACCAACVHTHTHVTRTRTCACVREKVSDLCVQETQRPPERETLKCPSMEPTRSVQTVVWRGRVGRKAWAGGKEAGRKEGARP